MSETYSFRWGVHILDAGHTSIPNVILQNYVAAGVKRHEFLLILHLASYHYESERGESSPSLSTIAKQTGWTVSRICQILTDLEDRKLLIRRRRPGTTTVYDFTGFSKAVLEVAATQAHLSSTTQAHLSTPLKPTSHEEETEEESPEENTDADASGEALLDAFGLGQGYREVHGEPMGEVPKTRHWSDRLQDPWLDWSNGGFQERDGVSVDAQDRVSWLVEKHGRLRPVGTLTGWSNGAIGVYKAGRGDWAIIEAGIKEACTRVDPQKRPSTLACRKENVDEQPFVKAVAKKWAEVHEPNEMVIGEEQTGPIMTIGG